MSKTLEETVKAVDRLTAYSNLQDKAIKSANKTIVDLRKMVTTLGELAQEDKAEIADLFNSAMVILTDPNTSAYLKENDPKALEQLSSAVRKSHGEK